MSLICSNNSILFFALRSINEIRLKPLKKITTLIYGTNNFGPKVSVNLRLHCEAVI